MVAADIRTGQKIVAILECKPLIERDLLGSRVPAENHSDKQV